MVLARTHNLRDIGGYPASDGRRVRSGVLLRSGAMIGLAERDYAEIRQLGIATVYDLRANIERERKPLTWHRGHHVCYYSQSYEASVGEISVQLAQAIRMRRLVPDVLRRIMHDVYRELPFEQALSYREIFHLLIAGRVPLLFSCSAGKDRTGLAAALILFALGVSQESIHYDYALSDLALDTLERRLLSDPRYAKLREVPRERYLPIIKADPANLVVAFEEIERRHGSVHRYLDSLLGVGPAEIDALRYLLLES